MSNLKANTYPNGKFKSQAMGNDDKTDGFKSGQIKSTSGYRHNDE